MTHDRYTQWIQDSLNDLAAKRYPNRPDLQAQYKLGFMVSAMASMMMSDTHNYYAFNRVKERVLNNIRR
jgi:hypothetical protein